ncbi:MAG: hypothetical protein WC223_11505 [Bacteroidales bacterium]|jgi:hypothetical protein
MKTKTIISALILLASLSSCSKKDDDFCQQNNSNLFQYKKDIKDTSRNLKNDNNSCRQNYNNFIQHYSNAKGTCLSLTKQDWYLTRNGSGGAVNIAISGSTNGERATIRTLGDGLISDVNINLDEHKNFNQKFGIYFNESSVPSGEFKANTIIFVYRNSDTLELDLVSGNLKFDVKYKIPLVTTVGQN